jgi:hypothetical protein
MTKDEEIKLGLKAAGVPEITFSTTLVKEQAAGLRDIIKDRQLIRARQTMGVFLHPKTKSEHARTRRLFYLFAKELFLSGTTVFCIPLSRLLAAIMSDDMEGDALMVEQVRMVLLLDFYEEGVAFPYSNADAAKLRAWVRARFEKGMAVSFLSDAPPDRCITWWPSSFIGFISDNTLTYPVTK